MQGLFIAKQLICMYVCIYACLHVCMRACGLRGGLSGERRGAYLAHYWPKWCRSGHGNAQLSGCLAAPATSALACTHRRPKDLVLGGHGKPPRRDRLRAGMTRIVAQMAHNGHPRNRGTTRARALGAGISSRTYRSYVMPFHWLIIDI